MKLEDVITPLTTKLRLRSLQDENTNQDMHTAMAVMDSHEALERRLALAVAALKDIRTADDDCVCDSEYSANTVAIETLAQIEEGK